MHKFISLLWSFSKEPWEQDQQEYPCSDNPCADNQCADNPCADNPCAANPENPKLQGRHHLHPQ
jgi:hypothetical protein